MSPGLFAEVITPNISEGDCIWKWGFKRGNYVTIRSLGWHLIQYNWFPNKKRRLGHRGSSGNQGVGPQKESTMLAPEFWVSSLQNCDKISFCCLSHPAYDILLQQSELRQGFNNRHLAHQKSLHKGLKISPKFNSLLDYY